MSFFDMAEFLELMEEDITSTSNIDSNCTIVVDDEFVGGFMPRFKEIIDVLPISFEFEFTATESKLDSLLEDSPCAVPLGGFFDL